MSEAEIDEAALAEVVAGLRLPQKTLSPKFFYDARGSELFEEIMRLPEYYPTRTELSILREHGPEIGRAIGPDAVIVEFGAGNVEKIRLLLDVLERPRAFVPIDISGEHLRDAVAPLGDAYPGLTVLPVEGDFTKPLELPAHPALDGARMTGFFPGSTIGNFTRAGAQQFLTTAQEVLNGGDLILGADLVKDEAVLHAAYNDAAGVTAAFNLNMLSHLNRLIGSDFDVSAFEHRAFYNADLERIEMHLVSQKAQAVRLNGETFTFGIGETIHSESSHKYTFESINSLAKQAGWDVAARICDERQWFSLNLLSPSGKNAATG